MKNNKKNNTNKKFIVIIVILCVLILISGGTLVYFFVENSKAEQLAKAKEEQILGYEQALNEAIDESINLCPQILNHIGEEEKSYSYFIENINTSTDIYAKATNANSLIRTTAFYFDQATSGDIDAIEKGESVEVILTPELTAYRDKLTKLRNKFTENWYGYLGKADLSLTNNEGVEIVTE